MIVNWERIRRWVLFGAGMLCGVEAGHLFYLERFAAGGAFLLMTGTFLLFSVMERRRGGVEEEPPAEEGAAAGTLPSELALFVAEEALNGLRRIGRTMPPSSMEVAQLEDRLDALLARLNVPAEERARLDEEFEKIKGRARLDEGRRALSQSTRL